ncbi:hypothetical protein [Streptomyces sp. NPDC059258]
MSRLLEAAAPPHTTRSSTGNNTHSTSRTRTTRHAPEEPTP